MMMLCVLLLVVVAVCIYYINKRYRGGTTVYIVKGYNALYLSILIIPAAACNFVFCFFYYWNYYCFVFRFFFCLCVCLFWCFLISSSVLNKLMNFTAAFISKKHWNVWFTLRCSIIALHRIEWNAATVCI
jgi:hypothetical protein